MSTAKNVPLFAMDDPAYAKKHAPMMFGQELTPAQLRLLRAVDACSSPDSPAEGWGEIYTHYSSKPGTPSSLEMRNFDRISDACEKKGLLRVAENEIDLTDAGRAALKAASR